MEVEDRRYRELSPKDKVAKSRERTLRFALIRSPVTETRLRTWAKVPLLTQWHPQRGQCDIILTIHYWLGESYLISQMLSSHSSNEVLIINLCKTVHISVPSVVKITEGDFSLYSLTSESPSLLHRRHTVTWLWWCNWAGDLQNGQGWSWDVCRQLYSSCFWVSLFSLTVGRILLLDSGIAYKLSFPQELTS